MADNLDVTGGSEVDLKNYRGPEGVWLRWMKEIDLVLQSRKQQAFEHVGEKIIKKYKNADAVDNFTAAVRKSPRVMFNVLWSNTQVLVPALYSRMPKAMGERIFKDQDPVGRLAAEGLERATQFAMLMQQDRWNYVNQAVVLDRLLPGRGQAFLQYTAEFEDATDENGEPIIEEGRAVRRPKPNTEKVEIHYCNWLDYLECTARTQYEVRWRAYRIWKSRAECIQEFGEEVGKAIELNTDTKKSPKGRSNEDKEFLQQAEIWVIQDKPSKQWIWISPGYKAGPLRQTKDPYNLSDFWNCPLPLCATTTTDSTYPTPDFVIYEGLADELDYVTKRIKAIVECIRLIGVAAAPIVEKLKNVTMLDDGQISPVENWAAFIEKGGFKGLIDWVPFDNCVAALPALQEYQQSLKAQIDEITSMPDIVRGSSDPNDPVYTQQQKSHWTVIKLMQKQQDVQRFNRELVRKLAEIIVEPGLFSDETISLMAGVQQMTPEKQQMWPQALQLLRDDRLRSFRIDIETDSTIALDEQQSMERWMQYLGAMKDIVGEVEAISTYRPELMKPIVESALATVRSMRTGRSVEGSWERAFDEIEANDKARAEQAAQQPPPPDYELMKAQNEQARTNVQQMQAQAEQGKLQLAYEDQQFNQWLEQQKLTLEGSKLQADFQVKSQKNEIEAGQAISREEIDRMATELEVFTEGTRLKLEGMRLEFDKQAKVLEMKEKLMEEARLDKEHRLETLKIVSDHALAQAKQGGSSGNGSGSNGGGSSSPVHINLNTDQPIHLKEHKPSKRRKARVRRNPDGSLEGEFEELPDETIVTASENVPPKKSKARFRRAEDGSLEGDFEGA